MGVIRGASDNDSAAFVGLPGNPVAVFVTFVRVVKPLLRRLSGALPQTLHPLPVRVAFAYKKKKDRREYVRVSLRRAADGELEAVKHPQDGAGILTSLTETDGLLEFAEDVTPWRRAIASVSLVCGDRWASRPADDLLRPCAASSGVLTLKNGSTGWSGHSAMAMPWRAVHTSILRRSSSTSALRRSSRSASGHRPTTG